VLFADLVGFTSLAESLDSEVVRDFQARYFDTASQIIERYGATVEKYIGDAVMAVWGAPQAYEDDADGAVRAGTRQRGMPESSSRSRRVSFGPVDCRRRLPPSTDRRGDPESFL
jgi:class 3 adenylate cyclase